MRGKHNNNVAINSDTGITPAENCRKLTAVTSPVGSPPRMRGKRPDKAQYQKEDRITPADAGKTTLFAFP